LLTKILLLKALRRRADPREIGIVDQDAFDTAWRLAEGHLPKADILRQAWLDAKADQSRPIQIAACGVVNAGKSTLLNALADAANADVFVVAPVRETTEVKRFDCDDYELMDTPGLDALENDDATAWAGIAASDLVLMVHNPRGGELGSEQVKLLEGLKRHGCAGRMVLVLSHLEAVRDNVAALSAIIGPQAKAVLGMEVPIFPVSSTNYLRGLRENKPALRTTSGVPALRTHIGAQVTAREREFIAERRARLEAVRDEMLAEVDAAIAERQARIVAHDRQTQEWRLNFVDDMRRLWRGMLDMIADYERERLAS